MSEPSPHGPAKVVLASVDKAGTEAESTKLLQARLGLVGKYGLFIILAFLAVRWLVISFPILEDYRSTLTGIQSELVLLLPIVLAALWTLARMPRLSATILEWMDAGATFLVCFALVGCAYADRDWHEGYTPVSNLILLRAIFVPASGRRTLAITVASLVPLLVSDFLLREQAATSDAVDAPKSIIVNILRCGILSAVATAASQVIYGLRREVRSAKNLGQYVLTEKIGEGGMGQVYRARHAFLRRPAAVKLIHPSLVDERELARFEREVQATARLTHPNTVAVFDYGRTEDGVVYYAMEYLAGLNLGQLVKRFGPQPASRVIHLLVQACGSLAEAHARGILHRDVKPENLILCERGGVHDVVKLVDFGLAKDLRRKEDVGMTKENTVLGTPLYGSPEGLGGAGALDARSDIFGLGAVGYFLLAGRPPFRGKTAIQLAVAKVNETPERPSAVLGSAVPADLEDLILATLDKDPDHRPQCAAALRDALLGCSGAGDWKDGNAKAWWEANAAQELSI